MKNKSKKWWNTEEKAKSAIPIRLLIFFVKVLPFWCLILLAFPVSLFYWLISPSARRASKDYQNRLANFTGSKSRVHTFRHIFSFSRCLMEKVSGWCGKAALSNVIFHDDDVVRLKAELSSGRGALLIGSHLGNIELLRSLAAAGETGVNRNILVTAIMDMDVSSNFTKTINEMNPRFALDIIPSGSIGIDTIGTLQERIEQGGLVVIAGDRTSASAPERSIRGQFLGKEADFPFGSFFLASLLGGSVYFVFALREGGTAFKPRYNMFVHASAVSFDCPRKERMARSRKLCEDFIHLLESYCALYPYQWYNFFDFWA